MRYKSEQLFDRAKKSMVGGVNSPVRSFSAVGGSPVFFSSGKGQYLYDVDGKKYIDYVCAWGSNIIGHADSRLIEALNTSASMGFSFGAPSLNEILLAERVCDIIESVDLVRMVNSGTEAAMTAIRIARGYTGKNLIIKFNGCYHGHADALLVKPGSGSITLGLPGSFGIPTSTSGDTISIEYNDVNAISNAFTLYGDNIAGVIVEPVACNMGCILPTKKFLSTLRNLCDENEALLIFDEVITGFRIDLCCAQKVFAITPDLTILGKIIGGGMPIGAVCGKKNLMESLAPIGKVYQAGTLSGNPVAMAVGYTVLEILKRENRYKHLSDMTKLLADGFRNIAKTYNVHLHVNDICGLIGIYFVKNERILEVKNFSDLSNIDTLLFKRFFHYMLDRGIYFAPSMYEACFLSMAHEESDIETTLTVFEDFCKQIK